MSEEKQNQQAEKKEKEKLPAWSCQVERDPQLQFEGKQGLTVGEIFTLKCQGEPAAFEKKEWQFELQKGFEYGLKLLEVKSYQPDFAELKVTTYKAGGLQFGHLVLTDGVHRQEIKDLKFAVESVVEPPKNNQPPQPYGPVSPMLISLPMWFWIIIAALAAVVVGWLIRRIVRSVQRKRVARELSKHQTALTPYNQFNKDLRSLMREYIFNDKINWPQSRVKEFVSLLNRYYRVFILREFSVPALEWSSGAVVRDIKSRRRKKLQKQTIGSLNLTLREFDKAIERIEKVDMTDCQQLLEITRKSAQSIARDTRSDL